MKYLLMVALLAVFNVTALAQTPEEKGLAIAVEGDKRGEGFGDSQVELKMVLIDSKGTEAPRDMRVKTLEGIAEEGDKSLMIFDTPIDQKGVAMLTYTHKEKSDDQWLYLPALKRVKKISSKNKSGPFVGSEFAFEDISSQEVEKYTYKYLRDETFDGQDCFVVERVPTDKYSGYTKQVAWIDKAEYRALKIEFYDRKKSLLKTLENKDYKLYLEKFWRPALSVMQNHQTGKATRLEYKGYEFQVGLNKKEFTKNSLKRAK
ncbi:MAG: outer membrane lipoprotein-sorting protein [Bermanella sp.]|jgi:outer membrane lipoprotein-sorting protein